MALRLFVVLVVAAVVAVAAAAAVVWNSTRNCRAAARTYKAGNGCDGSVRLGVRLVGSFIEDAGVPVSKSNDA